MSQSPDAAATESAAELYQQAVSIVVGNQKASTSWLQRQMRIGYNNAAQMIERMQAEGIVSAPNHVGRRDVLQALVEGSGANDDDAPATVASVSANADEKRSAAGDQLRLLIERVERLEEDKKGVGDDIKDVFLEAKAVGYDVKGMKAVIKIRKLSRDARMEEEAILETYKAALGIE